MKNIWRGVSIFLILIGGMSMLLFHKGKEDKTLLYDSSAITYDPKMESVVADKNDQIILPGVKEIVINQGSSDVMFPLYNVKGNDADLVFEVKLEEKNKVLRTTQRVAPGKAILMVPLPENLAKGMYHLKTTIMVYKKGKTFKINSGVVMTTLIVK